MWRSSALACLLLIAAPSAHAELCLPPIFEGGLRTMPVDHTRIGWLEILLRQHEVCWRDAARPDEKRVFVFGNSSVLGFPHATGDSAIGMINHRFEREGVPAHLYNLAMAYSYQIRDAVIIRSARRFEPDVIVYSRTFDDFKHRAPLGWPPVNEFMVQNSRAVDAFAIEAPPHLTEPLEANRKLWADDFLGEPLWRNLRQFGLYVRLGVGEAGRAIRARWFPGFGAERPTIAPAGTDYDCAKTREEFDRLFQGWRDWDVLAYLAQLKRETGVAVLVVGWPVAHQPRQDCHNARYRTRDLEAYRRWLRVQTAAHELEFLDLAGILAADDFLDSIHPTIAGQATIAERLGPAIRRLVEPPGGE